jgi:hypothetical protein
MRNFMVIAMQKQFGGKGGFLHDRRLPRGGAKNEQAELLREYEDSKSESTHDDCRLVCKYESLSQCASCKV